MSMSCWLKKKQYGQVEKQKAVNFFRLKEKTLSLVSWVTGISVSTLSSWDKLFDERMKPVFVPDNRGKASRVTAQTVRHIYEKAKNV